MHEADYLHGDIKPDNFTMGLGANSNMVYMIDFGLSHSVVDSKTKKHMPFEKKDRFNGTVCYASVNSHKGY